MPWQQGHPQLYRPLSEHEKLYLNCPLEECDESHPDCLWANREAPGLGRNKWDRVIERVITADPPPTPEAPIRFRYASVALAKAAMGALYHRASRYLSADWRVACWREPVPGHEFAVHLYVVLIPADAPARAGVRLAHQHRRKEAPIPDP